MTEQEKQETDSISKVHSSRSSVKRAMTQSRHNKEPCSQQILKDAKTLGRPFYYREVANGFSYDRKRHTMRKLVGQGKVVSFPGEKPVRFALPGWRGECGFSVNTMGIYSAGFGNFVLGLDWDSVAAVHDVRLEFDGVGGFCGVGEASGWSWVGHTRTWVRDFVVDGVGVAVLAFDSGHVQVCLRCSSEPFCLDGDGLWRMGCVLERVRGCLGFDSPRTGSWKVTSWHYGKDCRNEVSGESFNVTWKTWAGTMARIYYKREMNCVRVEEVQSPNLTLQDILYFVLGGSG